MSQLQDISLDIPRPIHSLDDIQLYVDQERNVFFRLITFINGDLWAESSHSTEDIVAVGEKIAELDINMSKLSAPVINGRSIPWDLANFLDNAPFLSSITDPTRRSLISYFIAQWKTEVLPHLPFLRKGLIHNDANDYNILSKSGRPTALIDFGDMVYSYILNEIAVTSTYLAMDEDQPIELIAGFLKGYHSTSAIKEKEVDLLYYFIAARLCTSVLQSARAQKDQPDNSYAQVSNTGAWALLYKWIRINPIQAKDIWRRALGFDVVSVDHHLRKRREVYMPKAYSLSYEVPIHMTGAAFQYMYDAKGNTILDAYNNIIQVGHCHPKVVEAGQVAMAKLNTNTRYLYDIHAEYSERLLSYFPSHIDQLFLVNSGSAAADLAIRLSRTFTGKGNIGVIEHGYHGNTESTIGISHYKYGKKGGQGKSSGVVELDLPDTYRGAYQGEDAGSSYASDAISSLTSAGDIAALIAEPIVGCGGQVPLADGYLTAVYEAVRRLGGVCISDEVQTGFGRTGSGFWGYELHDVVPDIIVMGKPIGNGHPMGAVATTKEIADAFDNGMEFFSSFGGNPVSCAIGYAVLEVLEEEQLMTRAAQTGEHLQGLIKSMMGRYGCIGDARGNGLFLGFDMVYNRDLRDPNPILAKKVVNELRNNNVLTSLDGPYNNVIKVKPPLCFDIDNSEYLANNISNILDKIHKAE